MNTKAAAKPLDVEVRELLESRRGTWQDIAKGAGVSHSWISQFMRDKIPNPGFATLQRLRAHLAA
jgi:transcriptional regulator with XRE-family HTH domain